MVKYAKLGLAALIVTVTGSVVMAERYADYEPVKGIWTINAIDVNPNHVDDYLTGLRKSQLPTFTVLKAHGLIDDYHYLVRSGHVKDTPNVLIMVHYTSAAALEPNKDRDLMIRSEIRAKVSKEQGEAANAGYEKYRQFIDTADWTEMKMAN